MVTEIHLSAVNEIMIVILISERNDTVFSWPYLKTGLSRCEIKIVRNVECI